MSTSTSKLAYDDCYTILDRALGSDSGIKVAQDSAGKASHLRSRLNYARQLDRKLSTETYAEGDPEYGVSQYDVLVIQAPYKDRGKWWIQIKKRDVELLEIEELGAAE